MTVALLSYTSASNAQDACRSYVGQTVSPVTFDTVAASFAGLKPKDEFETTAHYEARRSAALGGVSKTLIVAKDPEDPKFFAYDADAGVMRIVSYAFSNVSLDYFSAFSSAGLYGKIKASYNNVAVVVSARDQNAGSYTGTNGYGAKTEVFKIKRLSKAIFDRDTNASEVLSFGVFPRSNRRDSAVGELRVGPEEAKRLKSELKVAIVVAPKEPYVVTGNHNPQKPTLDNPFDLEEDFTILVADIRCGLVTDGAGKVLGAFPTL